MLGKNNRTSVRWDVKCAAPTIGDWNNWLKKVRGIKTEKYEVKGKKSSIESELFRTKVNNTGWLDINYGVRRLITLTPRRRR